MLKIFKRLLACSTGLMMLLTMAITTEVQAQDEIGTMVLVKGATFWQSPELLDGPGPEKHRGRQLSKISISANMK